MEDSCRKCSWKTNIHCGFASDDSCVFMALNRCLVVRASCLRQMNSLKPFSKIVKGKCPKDKPKCPKT
ncbi:hypothetical protein KR026_003424, partial [Drosophila bipectinata]